MISTSMKLLVSCVAALAYSDGNVRDVGVLPFAGAVKLRLKQPSAQSTNADVEPSDKVMECQHPVDSTAIASTDKEDWLTSMVNNITESTSFWNVRWFFGFVPDDTLVRKIHFTDWGVELLQRHDKQWVLRIEGKSNEDIKQRLEEAKEPERETFIVKDVLGMDERGTIEGMRLDENEVDFLLSWMKADLRLKKQWEEDQIRYELTGIDGYTNYLLEKSEDKKLRDWGLGEGFP